MKARVACALLAAGGSRRLGHPKQLVLHRGKPLVRLAAECARGSLSDACAVVLGAAADDVRHALSGLPGELLYNPDWQQGMASSVRLAEAWASERGSSALLLALCDQPGLTAAHLNHLILEYERSGLVVASRYARKNAVPALFPRAYFDALRTLRGDSGASRLLNGPLADGVLAIPWPEGEFDIDTAENERRLQHESIGEP